MTQIVKVQMVAKFLLSQEQFFTKGELVFARNLIKWLPYEQTSIEPSQYFEYLRSKRLKNHKQEAKFCVDIFEHCGVTYIEFRKIMISLSYLDQFLWTLSVPISNGRQLLGLSGSFAMRQ